MDFRGAKVKIVDVTPKFVAFKYLSSNIRSRIKRQYFLDEFQKGNITVENPHLLDK